MLRIMLATGLLALSACVDKSPPPQAGPPMEWRGQTYTACQDKIRRAEALEAEGIPTYGPVNGRPRKRLVEYITLTEHLSFGAMCGRGGAGRTGLIAVATSDIPADVSQQGYLANDLYEDMRAHGHSAEFIRAYIDDGRFEAHMKLRRLVE